MSQNIWIIYGVILIYFLIGGISFYIINRRKSSNEARKSFLKFITYFLIIHILFFSIIYWPVFFQFLAIVLIVMAMFELIRLFAKSSFLFVEFFIISMLTFIVLAVGFYYFSNLERNLILLAFLTISIFDSFSQISGQLWGKAKILPKVSPKKTVGGVFGGAVVAMISGYLLGGLYEISPMEQLILIGGIILFAFIGDMLASLYKRKYNVKDYSNLIPGHGGVLDRFDSLIAAGSWVGFYFYIL